METHPILVIDPYAVLSTPVAAQTLEPIARWNSKFRELPNPVDLIELPSCHSPERSRAYPAGRLGISSVKDVLSAEIPEGTYHTSHYNGFHYR
ncbi:hypothetical protein MELA_01478 [Candidatus Methylomirabilis lanthanidiphila]|uniref:Uncharacterized protein n=1 Tax=Candidatus Methylomirabilis lanthanidiphila TaxID=2211376 RepID=A0A564ZKD3_9BACT|nr:hypothetical protein MELA_01478 [Candidatus Methylomirabilis lanthanidiphila]